ncbi:MAG: hypothetical protein HRU38_24755 [Saccharospirillaceae bacterium]|nr:hypothetical protein [Pseudomonadales bacterium]NRB81832.1 hypothetical protein [Saccharospirillaceae bacterium]
MADLVSFPMLAWNLLSMKGSWFGLTNMSPRDTSISSSKQIVTAYLMPSGSGLAS